MIRTKLKIVVCISLLTVLVLNSVLWINLNFKTKAPSSENDATISHHASNSTNISKPTFNYTLLYEEMSHHSSIMNFTWRNEPIHKRNNASKPFIAVVVCAYSKKVAKQHMNSMMLATSLLPSLLKTMEHKAYDYALFVGVDDDDSFWKNKTNQDALSKMAGKLPVHISGFPAKKSHIPLNEILKVANDAGPDYIVRMNDDSAFETAGWTTMGINTLTAFDPPNVGVVGPTCHQGKTSILTHDMVHRTHMDIFNNVYYSDVFDNWWLDDWISRVYGPMRTTKIKAWTVKHHTDVHGTRYQVNHAKRDLLGREVEKGKLKIAKWLVRKQAKLHQMTIVVLTMNRADSLRRLLESLERADYGGDTVSLVIKVDKSKDNNKVTDLSNTFKFSHGPKNVFFASTNQGLRQAWFDAWTPRDDFDRGVIFEDDVEVCPQWYVWLRAAWAAYGPRTDMAGVSLARQVLVPKLPHKTMEIVNNHAPFMYALLGSNGFSPHPKQWLRFLNWIKSIDLNKFDVSTPDLVTSVWWNHTDKRRMWTQHFIYFTRGHDLYTVYVNLPDKKTLAAHHREKGEHVDKTGGRDFELATSVKMDFPKVLTKYGWDGVQVGVAANKTSLKKSN